MIFIWFAWMLVDKSGWVINIMHSINMHWNWKKLGCLLYTKLILRDVAISCVCFLSAMKACSQCAKYCLLWTILIFWSGFYQMNRFYVFLCLPNSIEPIPIPSMSSKKKTFKSYICVCISQWISISFLDLIRNIQIERLFSEVKIQLKLTYDSHDYLICFEKKLLKTNENERNEQMRSHWIC